MWRLGTNLGGLVRSQGVTGPEGHGEGLEDLGEVQVLRPPDLELSRPEDGDVVVQDGILVTRWLQTEHDSLLLLKRESTLEEDLI